MDLKNLFSSVSPSVHQKRLELRLPTSPAPWLKLLWAALNTPKHWRDACGERQATTKKIFLGKGVKYFSKAKVGEFVLETHSLKKGDKVLITGPTTGVIEKYIDELRVDDKAVDEAQKGEHFSIRIDEPIRASDKLYKIVETQ